MVHAVLLAHLITTLVLGLLALASTAFIVYRLLTVERARLNDAETHAFQLMDEMLVSFIPRNLSTRLSQLYKVEAGKSAMTDNRAMLKPSSKEKDPSAKPVESNKDK